MANVEVESINLDIDDWEEISEYKEKLAEAKKEQGNEMYKLKRYKNALSFYTEAIELSPNNPSYYGNRSACYIMLGKHGLALNDAKKAVFKDPSFVKGWIRMAKCLLAIGDLKQAELAFKQVAQLEPQNSTYLQEVKNLEIVKRYDEEATKAYEKADYRKVVFCMDRALEVGGACVRFKVIRAECLARVGRFQDAQDVANEIISTDRNNADAVFARALCFYYQDNIDSALTFFQHILKLAPDHVKAQAAYKKAKSLKMKREEGNNAYQKEKYEEAVKLYSEALTVDSCNIITNAKVYCNRATALSKMKKYEEAIKDCTEALKLDSTYLKAFLRRAACYMELAKYEEAVKDYEEAYKMDKSCKRELHDAKVALKKSLRKDYYKILGVDKKASSDDIKKAYRKRALVHHPDRHAHASDAEKKEQEKMFKEVGEAYTILSDPNKRLRYDNGQDFDDPMSNSGDFDDPQNLFAFFSDSVHGQQFFSAPGGRSFSFAFQ